MGGSDEERTYAQIKQGDLALSSKSQYFYHSRTPTFSTEYSNRQEIKKKKTYSTRWTLHPKVFQANSRLLGSLTIDLFASCLWHHPPQYIVWHPDPYSQWTDATIQNWNMGLSYAFPLSV